MDSFLSSPIYNQHCLARSPTAYQECLFVDRERVFDPSGGLLDASDASKRPFPRRAGRKGHRRPPFLLLGIAFSSTGRVKMQSRALPPIPLWTSLVLSGPLWAYRGSLFIDRERVFDPSGWLLKASDASKVPFPRQAEGKCHRRPLFWPLGIAFSSTGRVKMQSRALPPRPLGTSLGLSGLIGEAFSSTGRGFLPHPVPPGCDFFL